MTVYALLTEKQTFFDANSNELSGGKLFVYLAGTTTKATSYAETDGISANSNPIVLNSRGEVPNGLYVAGGSTYKLVLAPSTDTDPPSSPIWTRDNLAPVNDVSAATASEWVSSTVVATQINATQFSVPGDQRTIFQVGRRVQAASTAGTRYGTVSVASFGAGITTVTLAPLSGNLDSGLTGTTPSVGLLGATNPSVPELTDDVWRVADSADRTKRLAVELANLTTATTRTLTVQDKSGIPALVADLSAPYNASLAASVSGNVLTINLKNAAGNDASAGDPVYIPFRHATVTTGTPVVVAVTAALPLSIPQGATLGFANSEAARIHIYALNNSGIVELVAYRAQTGGDVAPLSETGVVTTTAVTTGPNSAQVPYSASARSNVAVSYLGYIEIATGATAGDWSSNPTAIVTYRPGLPKPGQVVQTVATSTGSASTFGTGGGETIPLDNTIPQSGEGTQILTKAITPKSIYNVMRVEAVAYMAVNSNVHLLSSLFNGGSNAIAATAIFGFNASVGVYPIRYSGVAGSASAITYSLRTGPATAATVTLNGLGGSQLLGGTLLSSLTVNEIWA